MATSNEGFILSLPASVDLSTSQFLAAVVDSSGEAAIAGAGVKICGILQTKTSNVGEAASIQTDRISKFVAGSVGVSAGDELEIEAGGDFITLASGVSVGFCLVDTAAAGIGSMLLK